MSKITGQVLRGSDFGEIIYRLSLIKEFNNYLEVGTWRGLGSTKCFVDGLMERLDASCLYSLEANKEFFQEATHNWMPTLMMLRIPKLKLLYGRIIEPSELVSEQEIKSHSRFSQHPWLEWRERNIKEYGECENIIDQLPEEIDVALFDGGQFSTREEWNKLKEKVKVVLLDDTTTFKTESIRKEILQSDEWKVLYDENDRHGFFVATRKEYYDLVKSV